MNNDNPSTYNPYFNALETWWQANFYGKETGKKDILKYLRQSFAHLDLQTANEWVAWYNEHGVELLTHIISDFEDESIETQLNVGDYFAEIELNEAHSQLIADIPVQLGDTGLYALFVYGERLLENISVTQKQLIRARGLDKAVNMPTPDDATENPHLIEPYISQVREIQQRSGRPSDYDRAEIEALGGGWLLKASQNQKQMSTLQAYEILYNEWQDPLRTMQIELYLASILGSTVLFNADGSLPKGIVGPFRVRQYKGRNTLDIVSPIDPLVGLIKDPEPKLNDKQKVVMRQMGVDINIERRPTYTVEQRILWALNFIIAFPHFMDHFGSAVRSMTAFMEDQSVPRWLPDSIKEVAYPTLDDTFLY